MTTETNKPELTPDELALILAFRAGDKSKINALTKAVTDAKAAADKAAQKASIRAIMDAQTAGDPVATAEAMAAMHEAYADYFAEQREINAKEDALHDAFIRAESDYSIPLSERIALFMIARLVLDGHFSRAIYTDGLQTFVRSVASALREGIIGSYETDQFIRTIKDEADGSLR